MKKINKAIMMVGLSLSTLLAGGCQDFLTTDMPSYVDPDVFFTNEVEADMGIIGIFSYIADGTAYGSTLPIEFDSGCDEGYYNRRYSDGWPVALYCYTSADPKLKNVWTALYQTINHANLFLENLKVENFTPEVANKYIGEARFLRALAYMNLVSYWDEVPLRTKSTKVQADNHVPAASLEELYAFIIDDFTFAAENLPHAKDDNYIGGHPNAMAARGLMARMYMKQAGFPYYGGGDSHLCSESLASYALAKEQLDIIIADGWHELRQTTGTFDAEKNNGYRDTFLDLIGDVYSPKENMFEISYSWSATTGMNTAGSLGAYNGLAYSNFNDVKGPEAYAMHNASVLLNEVYCADDEYYYDPTLLITTDSIVFSDPRKYWNTPGIQYGKGNVTQVTPLKQNYASGKYRRWEPKARVVEAIADTKTEDQLVLLERVTEYNKSSTSVNFPVLRYADVVLMKSEVEYWLNGQVANQTCYDYLNMIRTRVGLPALAVGEYSNYGNSFREWDFFDELVTERMKELCFEGVRTFDLRRWNILEERLKLSDEAIANHGDFVETDDQARALRRTYTYFQKDPEKFMHMAYPLVEVTMNDMLDQKPQW